MRLGIRARRAPRIDRTSAYHGSEKPARRYMRGLSFFAVAAALASAGCSMSFPLGSLLPEKNEERAAADAGDVTGSIPMQLAPAQQASQEMSKADWISATSAMREALDSREDGASVPWQNRTSGAQGTVTPISAAFTQDGFSCRNFLTSYLHNGQEAWFEGTACRVHRGRWDIRSTRPLQKS